MGLDLDAWTVRVLSSGLPPLPARLEPSQTVPVALWRGEHYGAVLFLRLWRNGNVDSDCAISSRSADGSWEPPMGSGGGGWIDDPLVRSQTGWQGDPVFWQGLFGLDDYERDPEDEPSDAEHEHEHEHDLPVDNAAVKPGSLGRSAAIVFPAGTSVDEINAVEAAQRQETQDLSDRLGVRAITGAAAVPVAAIEVEQAERKWLVPIDSPCGAFIVVLEQPGPAIMRPLDHHGMPLPDADGETDHRA